MSLYAVKVSNLWKKYRIYHDKAYSLKDKILFLHRNKYEVRWILKDVSFDIKRGESVGIIGRNGSGKSTLLKLITKIIYPDKGEILVNGRIASLLELGAGFHPDMSGRDNIYINASILGLSKKEIDKRYDEIVKFSELEEYIDNPVRTYSSGMYVRLAFSVAIHVSADILIIDEVLAVGDLAFQEKCLNKIKEIQNNGATIIIVSHSLRQIEDFCSKSIWVNNGSIKMIGKCREVHEEYRKYMLGS